MIPSDRPDDSGSSWRFRAEWSADEPVAIAVARAVAAVEGVPMEDLPSVGDAVDPDALDALFAGAEHEGDCWIVFEYANYEVAVSCGGDVLLRSP